MGLLQNISLRFAQPYNSIGYTSELRTSQLSCMLNKYVGEGDIIIYYGVPIGNLAPTSWNLPIREGGMASLSTLLGSGVIINASSAAGIGIATILINGVGQFETTPVIKAPANINSGNHINGLSQFDNIDILAYANIESSHLNGLGQFDLIDIKAYSSLSTIINGIGILNPADILASASIRSTINNIGQFLDNPIIKGGINAMSNISGSGQIINANLWNGIYTEQLVAAIHGLSSLIGNVSNGIGISSTIHGTSTFNSDIKAIAKMVIEINSLGSLNSNIKAHANIVGNITPFTELSPQSLASAVWNSIAAEYNISGTMGDALANVGGAADPWATILPDTYTNNQAGALLYKILKIAKFLQVK